MAKAYKIETDRLIIRCYEPADASLLLEAISDSIAHLKLWMPWAQKEPTTLAAKIELLRKFRGNFDLEKDFTFGVFNKAQDVLIGSTGLHTRTDDLAREIGYWVNTNFLNQGYATEIVSALTKVGFELEGLDRIEIHCATDNIKSQRIPQKLDFKLEATLERRMTNASGQLSDCSIFTMFKKDYDKSPIKFMTLKAFDVVGQTINI